MANGGQVITKWIAQTDEYKRKTKEAQGVLERVGASGKQAGQMIGQMDKVLGTSIGTLGKLSVATAAASGAMKVMKDAFFSSESNIDEWGRTVEGAKGAYNTFISALNTGNWDGFFSRLNDAINGGRELYDIFDQLGSMKVNNSILVAELENKLADLRLAKQQGKDVDAEIKRINQKLAGIKDREVVVGKKGNYEGFIQTLENKGVSKSTAKEFWQMVKAEGDVAFTKAKTERSALAYSATHGDKKSEKLFNEWDAIVEAESDLKQYILGYKQAVEEGTAAKKAEFKYAKWGQSGSGSGGKSGGKTGSGKSGATEEWAMIDYTPDFGRSQAEIESHLKMWRESYANAGDDAGRAYAQRFIDKLESELKAMTGNGSESNPLSDALKDVKIKLPEFSMEDAIKGLDKKSKNVADGWQKAAGAVGQLGSALQGLEDPGAKVAGIVAEAVANIASTFATSLKGTATPWDWIAAAISGTATMISTISAIKSATSGSYAQGGIIPGANNGGRDNTWAYVSPGEVILNKAQQRNLAGQLNGGGQSSSGGSAYVSGEMIVMAVNAWGRRTGRGEILR